MIRKAQARDFEQIWPLFQEIVRSGDTYAYPRNINKIDAFEVWITTPRETYLVTVDNEVLGTYYIKSNQLGPGQHVCNCGYMVSSTARGQGLASSMCEHSQKVAKKLGYQAMQFNFVASSNEGAIRLWTKLGFEIVGRLPKAFNHPINGLIDALVMYKWLGTE